MKRCNWLLAIVLVGCAPPAQEPAEKPAEKAVEKPAPPKVANAADKPDPRKVMDEADALARAGKHEEALQKYLWYHDNAVKIEPALYGVRLSFALGHWEDLGKKYPKAKQAMIDVRDRDTKSLREGRGDFHLFHDVEALNETLKDEAATIALFKELDEKQPALAKECYRVAEAPLVAKREYALCAKYLGDPFEKFEEARKYREALIKERPDYQPAHWHAEKEFVRRTSRIVAILAGAGRGPDAEKIRTRALQVRDDANIREHLDAALKAAEKP